jgi:hypothetical protein
LACAIDKKQSIPATAINSFIGCLHLRWGRLADPSGARIPAAFILGSPTKVECRLSCSRPPIYCDCRPKSERESQRLAASFGHGGRGGANLFH